MTFSFVQIALVCLCYLSLIFAIAYVTEKGWISQKVVNHPLTYIFSLGIFASAWSYYGVIELASQFGYGALAYYFGTGVMFLFAPFALQPLIAIARRYQINSMADLLTFRYDSHAVGGVVTVCMLLAMLPLLALQVQAVADTIHILIDHNANRSAIAPAQQKLGLAFLFCVFTAFFSMKFGSKRDKYKGLIIAMAFESLIKVFGLVAIGIFATIHIFGGLDGLDRWLLENPEQLERLSNPIQPGQSHTLLLVFVATAVAMPHIFHIAVIENPIMRSINTVSWVFPIFLLVMALPIFPILWAGIAIDSDIPTQYYPLAIPLFAENKTLTLVAFTGGLSAATGAMIAIAIALATMMLNHFILPHLPLRSHGEITKRLAMLRRLLIGASILIGFIFYVFLQNKFDLVDLALTAFIATLQLLPGVMCVVYWTKGNRNGFIAGLSTGMSLWTIGIFIPLLAGIHTATPFASLPTLQFGIDHWSDITLISLTSNMIVFILVSSFTSTSDSEKYSANLCSQDELSHPIRMTLNVNSADEMINRLSLRIGESTTKKEVERALSTLGLNANERRPFALRQLRDEIEANLSGLMGISTASEIMDEEIPFIFPHSHGAIDINMIESRLNEFRHEFTGLSAELNDLRLYHRQTLQDLPMAACSVGTDMEILMWNKTMEKLTHIQSENIIGSRLQEAPEPWGKLLGKFAQSKLAHYYKREITLDQRPHWITLHKASIPSPLAKHIDGQVMLLEDVTDLQILEQEVLHTERLASIGRLAAGVAHEIGNPVTGIACLAQNMKYETDNDEVLDTAEQILSQTQRVSRIVHSLVSFSHSGENRGEEFSSVKIKECAEEALNLLRLQQERRHVDYINRVPDELTINGDSQRIIQIFINLLSNARDASQDGDVIHVDGELRPDRVLFSVTDQGCGISDEVKARILEPFFTTKDPGQGTGLGMAMVYSIVEDHKGSLNIISPADKEKGVGTKIEVLMPRMQS